MTIAGNTTRPAPLTVWVGSQMYTFSPGRDITVGRGDDADVRVSSAHKQALSRHHLVLRHDGTQWMAIDKSRNGIYVHGRRMAVVAIDDDTTITLGGAEGPVLTFRVTTQAVPAARQFGPPTPPATRPTTTPRPGRPPHPAPPVDRRQPPPPPRHTAGPPAPPRQPLGPPPPPLPPRPAPPQPRPIPAPESTGLTGAVKRMTARPTTPAPGALSIGRSSAATVVVDDPLVSRVHAIAERGPAGLTIRDNASSNGTFVNGMPVGAPALLRPGDVITVGNTDLNFDGAAIAPRATPTDARGITAQTLALTIDGHRLLTDVSFTARPGTLTAVIGPSGAGKSTLIKLLGGQSNPTEGTVVFDGHDLHADYASLRSRIGLVPQDDVVHRSLTVSQALRYAAELRLPPDTSRADRHALVDRVLAELELTEHRNKRVDTLSGGQRKRASVAMELLTGPSLLILDEPTSGLDPALDRQVMTMLRKLADAGRVVIVVTHSLTYLNLCDQVLLLAPGGKTAFAGPPAQVAPTLGTADWADIFAWVSSDPDGAHRAFRARTALPTRVTATPAAPGTPAGRPARTSPLRQVLTVARRQLRLLVADRGYFAFLLLLPFLLGGLALVVPGDVGLGKATTAGGSPNEPNQLLILLNIAAVFMGTALTIRDLVGERSIFRREQSVGLSAGAYLTAKVFVYSVIAALQAAVLTAIVVYGKGGPATTGVLIGNADVELYVTLAATAIVSAAVGLMLSSLARTGEQILPMLVATVFLSIVFSGGMIPITGRIVLEQLSWFLPARWGFAASASTMDLMTAAPMLSVDDPLWRHARNWWTLDIGMLAALGVVALMVVAARLRLPGSAGTARGATASRRPMRVAVPLTAVLLIGAAVAGLTVLTREGGSKNPSAPGLSQGPPQGPAPSQDPVAPEKLAGLLIDPAALGSAINAPQLASVTPTTVTQLNATVATPPQCTSTVEPGTAEGYRGHTVTGVAGQSLADPADARNTVVQYVVGFPTADDAARYQDSQMTAWRDCASTTVTVPAAPGAPPQSIAVDAVDSARGRLSVVITTAERACQRVLSTDSNVVIDIRTCAAMRGQQAEDVASQIEDKIS